MNRRMRDLSSELDMLAAQLREALTGGGARPNPWRFDDWLTEYRQQHEKSTMSRREKSLATVPCAETSSALKRGANRSTGGVGSPITAYLRRCPAWPLLASLRDGDVYVGDKRVPRSEIDRIEHN